VSTADLCQEMRMSAVDKSPIFCVTVRVSRVMVELRLGLAAVLGLDVCS